MKVKFSRQTLEKKSNIKFREKSKIKFREKSVLWESACSMCTDRQTDKHDKANSCSCQFCKRG